MPGVSGVSRITIVARISPVIVPATGFSTGFSTGFTPGLTFGFGFAPRVALALRITGRTDLGVG